MDRYVSFINNSVNERTYPIDPDPRLFIMLYLYFL